MEAKRGIFAVQYRMQLALLRGCTWTWVNQPVVCGVDLTKGQELVFITATCIYSSCAILLFFFFPTVLYHNMQNATNFRFRYTTVT